MAEKWIRRLGSKASGFRYTGPDGKAVRKKDVLERIDLLRIPPAWRDVHIAANSRAAIQVWGFDARGRKQYRYHQRAVEKGALRKYYRVRQMAKDLPRIRRKLNEHFKRDDFSRERVCAGIVLLISHSFFRIGSDRYEKENNTFGITTLRKAHVFIEGGTVIFEYRGKRSISHRQVVSDPRLAAFITELLETPGKRLFRYREGRKWIDVDAREVNDYIEELAGFPYTAKDFRTWGGSLRAATVLADLGPASTESARRKNVVTTVRVVAADLGNTPAICRKSYVHPVIFTRYLKNGTTISLPRNHRSTQSRISHTPEERALIQFLEEYFPERRKERRAPEKSERGK
jgi:DNA topoisomerase-1